MSGDRDANAPFVTANRELWDEWTAIHETSAFYDLDGFRAGGVRIRPYEIEEIGSVEGQSLLHLQCHFGIDTLSWARLGARVTGADFSPAAVGAGVAPGNRAGLSRGALRPLHDRRFA